MSNVILQPSPEQKAALERQKRMSTIASLAIAILGLGLVMLILAFVLLPTLTKEEVTVVAYASPKFEEQELQKKEVTSVDRKPAPPSSSMAKVIAANTQSPTAIPVPEFNTDEVSLEFGSGADFGDGWEDGDMAGMGGGATFFKQKVTAQRIAYVIDYSQSMNGERDKLMRAELTKSIKQLTAGMQIQLIFFCGPAWVAGSTVEIEKDDSDALVTMDGETFKWRGRGPHEWRPSGTRQKPEWISLTNSTLDKVLADIKSTPLKWGTDWEPALEMAMDMEPAPQIIFFMTDGSVSGDMKSLGRRLASQAKRKNIIVNTVAMMEPDAEEGMKELAEHAGGQFSVVSKGGKVEVVPFD